MKLLPIACAGLAMLTAACSSFSAKLDKDRARSVKKVALLSMEIAQQQPKDALGLSKAVELNQGRMTDSAEFQSMASNVYKYFGVELQRKTGWQVASLEKVISTPDYASKVKELQSGLHLATMAPNGSEMIALNGMLSKMSFRRLSHAEKVKLAREMGADAFAELIVYQSIDQGWSVGNLTGDAPFAFTSRANLMVYGLDSEEPIWRQQNVDGNPSSRSDTLPESKTKWQRLSAIGESSANSSIKKLVESYKVE